jgi:acetylornithine/N-succinyldiaminopimelate aminotransferase
MSETEVLQKRFAAALMPNYGLPPLAVSHGQGCRVWDADGREYLDLIAGIAVSSLGHAHPAIVEAVSRQVADVAHTSNLFLHERELELAERILCLLGGDDPPQTPPAHGGAARPPVPPRPPRPPALRKLRLGGSSLR